jgi:hypothetical protein
MLKKIFLNNLDEIKILIRSNKKRDKKHIEEI